MNKTIRKIYDEVGAVTGLRTDETTETLNGVISGYHITVAFTNNYYTVYASVRRNNQLPEKEALKNMKKSIPGVKGAVLQKNNVAATVTGMTTKKVIENLISAVKGLTDFFRMNNFEDVCECCGKSKADIKVYAVGASMANLCDECYSNIGEAMQQAEIEYDNTQENILAGAVGAFIGSLIGVIAIIIIGQLGYVAVISGLIMGVCAIKGYEMLGKKITSKGVIISLIIMILMIYVATKSDWCISISRDWGWSFFDIYGAFWNLATAADATGDFIASLIMQYLFAGLGAASVIVGAFKSQKSAFQTHQVQ